MSNPWFRMYAEFATDPKVQMLSEAMQRRLLMILCLRCSNTLVTLQPDEIAFQMRISETDLEATKAAFVAKGFIDNEWNVLNWEKRQFASDSSAARVAKHRALQKEKQEHGCNVTETKSNALDTDTEADTDKKRNTGRARASRLPTDFTLPDDWSAFCQAERPDLDPAKTFDKFRDYWTAKAGKDGAKLNWLATWRNWVREERRQATPQPVAQRQQPKTFEQINREEGWARWEEQTNQIHPDRIKAQERARQSLGQVIDVTPRPLEIAQ
jgi:hypothetical protein